MAYHAQKDLEQRWHLVLPDRPGHGQSPREGREDFERDATLLAPLLEPRAHLVGDSYGSIVALYMAAMRPDAVESLTLIEPPAYWLAIDDPDVAEMSRRNQELFEAPTNDPGETVRSFFKLVGIGLELPDPVPEPFLSLAGDFADMRGPWEGNVDADALTAGGYPIQVLTSGRTAGFEAIAQAIVRQTGAVHIVVPDTDHAVQFAGVPVNTLLEQFWTAS